MAKPELETNQRVAELEKKVDRLVEGVTTLTAWLVSCQTGFGQKDMEGINDIVLGRTETPSEGSTGETQ